MYPGNFLFVIIPIALYFGLVLLPVASSYVAALTSLAVASAFMFASLTADKGDAFDPLGIDFDAAAQALFSVLLFGAAAGAVGYALVAGRRGASWPLRAGFFIVGVAVAAFVVLVFPTLR